MTPHSDADESVTVRWSVCFYDGDSLVREVDLQGIRAAELQRILGVPAENPLCDCYPVGARELAELAPCCQEPLPLQLGPNQSAFVEASQA